MSAAISRESSSGEIRISRTRVLLPSRAQQPGTWPAIQPMLYYIVFYDIMLCYIKLVLCYVTFYYAHPRSPTARDSASPPIAPGPRSLVALPSLESCGRGETPGGIERALLSLLSHVALVALLFYCYYYYYYLFIIIIVIIIVIIIIIIILLLSLSLFIISPSPAAPAHPAPSPPGGAAVSGSRPWISTTR